MKRIGLVALALALTLSVLAGELGERPEASTGRRSAAIPAGIHKIKHVIVIMQENRSFDTYFGTYPGADGIPRRTCCVCPIRAAAACGRSTTRPTSTAAARTRCSNAPRDIDGGAMDGFVARGGARHARAAATANDPVLRRGTAAAADVMGYHDAREIPNYWAYARNFVLQDHMFEPNASWSLPAHLFMVSRVVGDVHATRTTR